MSQTGSSTFKAPKCSWGQFVAYRGQHIAKVNANCCSVQITESLQWHIEPSILRTTDLAHNHVTLDFKNMIETRVNEKSVLHGLSCNENSFVLLESMYV